MKSAVSLDNEIHNDNFERDKKKLSWKWMIILAYGTANVLIIPVITSFGLIFKDKFKMLNLTALEATLILNLNSALGMILGLFNGALLNVFGFRKIAVLGGIFFSGGIMSTAFANSFKHFLITYSIITSIGMGLCTSSFSLALNTYFKEDRNKAFGLGATITGLGPIMLPHLIAFLLNKFGTEGCVLIIGGLCLHIIAAGLLLKPFKADEFETHRNSIGNDSMYKPPPSLIGATSRERASIATLSDDGSEYLETCPIYHDVDTQSIYGVDVMPMRKSEEILWKDLDYKFVPKPIKRAFSEGHIALQNRNPDIEIVLSNDGEDFYPSNTRRWFESGSAASVHLESSLKLFHEEERAAYIKKSHSRLRIFDEKGFLGRRASFMRLNIRRNTVAVIPEDEVPKVDDEHRKSAGATMLPTPPSYLKLKKPPSKISKCFRSIKNGWKRFVKVFDLGLLTDKIYINLVIGIAIAIFAEINFSLLTPFILSEFNYTTEQIATFMSTLATVDIFCRFTSPYIGDFFKQPARIMYMYALFMLIIMRTSLLFAKTYHGIIYVAVGMGLAKGVRQVYMSCIVPSYIPIERLPAASGIQMVANGIVLLSMGSSIGMFHDLFGSYAICIIFINIMTFITLTLWVSEMIYMKRKNVKNAKEVEETKVPELCKLNIEVN